MFLQKEKQTSLESFNQAYEQSAKYFIEDQFQLALDRLNPFGASFIIRYVPASVLYLMAHASVGYRSLQSNEVYLELKYKWKHGEIDEKYTKVVSKTLEQYSL